MLHLNILALQQKKIFDILSESNFISEYYLAGGTSLALQIGHRMSEDFDFFSPKDLNPQFLKAQLSKIGIFKVSYEEQNTLHGVLEETKVSFITFNYKLLEQTISEKQFVLCSLLDLACMKLSAIQSRGTKRDFVDFYFLLQRFTIKEILDNFQKKFGSNNFNLSLIKKSLVFFEDAESQLMPVMLNKIEWDEIKNTLRKIESSI
ncbi:MAG: nucleotidyl transferase AbiEii/AbiGii toxin family protein [Ignavibacteria bacterium]|jgi:predicted nucleotidyltransferase component of viral defense system|nr:nucleotidyl transferase AbiEii/AbiGii toxin family protein [Ignavibacteria bacterium]